MGQIQVGEHVAVVDNGDVEMLSRWQWHAHPAGHVIYARGYPKGERSAGLTYMHRLLMGAGPDDEIDHHNGNGLDNRRANLRFCTRTQNSANRHRVQSRTSRFKGVHLEKWTGRWRAEIHKDGCRYTLGRFDSQEEAAAAYEKKAKELYPRFGRVASR